MNSNRIVEYVFFFGVMGVVGYLVWQMFSPFISALALAAVIVTICYPMYERVVRYMPRNNTTLAALVTTLLVLVIVILPVLLLSSLILREAVAIYQLLGSSEDFSVVQYVEAIEAAGRQYVPGLELNLTEYLRQGAQWLASHLGAIFAGTASTIFLFFIAIIASFYFFRDGKIFTKRLVQISPLPDSQDELILRRLSVAVRSVATGTILVALIQGTLTALGLTLFGFERAILLGAIAAFGALIPSVGTSIVFIPSVLYLLFTGSYIEAIGLAVWGTLAVGLIDNLLGPYLMSRGNVIHPFLILLSVLGGVIFFGPIGFVVGPVLVSFFIVLLELYNQHIAKNVSS
ncbi:MAG: AI-2E family transporter [Candidatus Paceibacterota bacterium]